MHCANKILKRFVYYIDFYAWNAIFSMQFNAEIRVFALIKTTVESFYTSFYPSIRVYRSRNYFFLEIHKRSSVQSKYNSNYGSFILLSVKFPTICNFLADLLKYIAYSIDITMGLCMQYAIINTNHLIKRAIKFHGRNAFLN